MASDLPTAKKNAVYEINKKEINRRFFPT